MRKEIEAASKKLDQEHQLALNNILVLKENLLQQEKSASFLEGQKEMIKFIANLPKEEAEQSQAGK
jgi:hypothetical protein